MATSRTTIFLSETDRHILATLQDQYGVRTRSAALRSALRTGAERQEQQTALAEQLTTLRGELRQAHDAIAALEQERQFLLKELQALNAEWHHLSAAAAAPPPSASERSLRRQQDAHVRATAQSMCLHAKQVRETLPQQQQRWHTTVERLLVQVRSIVLQSQALIQPPTLPAEETP